MGCGVGFPGRIVGTVVGLLEGDDGATVGRDDVGMAVVGCTLGMAVVGLDEVGWDDAGAKKGLDVVGSIENGWNEAEDVGAGVGCAVGHAE